MPTPWTSNTDWRQPIKREVCGHVSDRYIPCPHPKPCPHHDGKAGASSLSSLRGAGRSIPKLSQFDPWDAA